MLVLNEYEGKSFKLKFPKCGRLVAPNIAGLFTLKDEIRGRARILNTTDGREIQIPLEQSYVHKKDLSFNPRIEDYQHITTRHKQSFSRPPV